MASYRLAVRHDTAANWTSADPVLAQGEFGYETDTGKIKIGDSATSWSSLAYFADEISNDYVDSHLNTDSASSGDFLSWDGSDYVWTVPNSGGAQTFTDLTATSSFTSPGIDDNATTTQLTIEDGSSVFNNDTKVSRAHRYGTAFSVENTSTGGKAWELRSTGVDNLLGTGDLQFNVDSNSSLTLKADRSAEFSGDLTASGNFTSKGIDDNATSTAITIDASENVGIGTTTPAQKLEIHSDANTQVRVVSGDTSGSILNFGTTTNPADGRIVYSNATKTMQFRTNNGGYSLNVDSTGNVGIGSTAPARNLTIGGDTAATTHLQLTNATSGTSTGDGFQISQYTSGAVQLWNKENSYMAFGTNNTERMRIDASGTTTVTGGFEAAQPGAGTGAFAAGNRSGATSQGTYTVAIGYAAGETSQDDYSVASGFAAGQLTQGSYAIAIGNSAGKTTQGSKSVAIGNSAGNVTQGGNAVAIGASAGYRRQGAYANAFGDNAGFTDQGSYAVAMGLAAGKTDQGEAAIAIGNSAGFTTQGTNSIAMGVSAAQNTQGTSSVAIGYTAGFESQGANSIAIGNAAGTVNQGANGILISSSGVAENMTNANHIVLKSSATDYLYFDGLSKWTFGGGDVTIPNDNLLVGTTDPSPNSNFNSRVVVGTESGVAGIQVDAFQTTLTTAASFTNANGMVGRITTSGSATAYNTSSDERLKENVVDAPAGNIDSIKVRSFDWKVDGEHQDYGFIAQELETVAPYAVSKGETDEDMWGVDYSKLVPMLVKEIQDLKAKVEALENA